MLPCRIQMPSWQDDTLGQKENGKKWRGISIFFSLSLWAKAGGCWNGYFSLFLLMVWKNGDIIIVTHATICNTQQLCNDYDADNMSNLCTPKVVSSFSSGAFCFSWKTFLIFIFYDLLASCYPPKHTIIFK